MSGPRDSVWSAPAKSVPYGAADHERHLAAGLAALLQPAGERLGGVGAAARVEQAHVRALRDPARERRVVGAPRPRRPGRSGTAAWRSGRGRRRRAAAPGRPRPRSSARCGMLSAMDGDDRERHFNLHTTPEVMAGVYANFATVSHSDYEFTLTFSRVDHEVEADEVPGVVVTRVSLSPQAMRELIDAMEDNWSKWRTREGIKRLPGDRGDLLETPAPGRSAPSCPGGSRARRCSQRGGAGSPTFCSVIRRSKRDERVGLAGQLERERVGAPLDRPRELVGDDADAPARPGSAPAPRPAPRVAPAGVSRSAAPGHGERAANGATSASHSRPHGHVAVADVAELVRDHEPRLRRREVVAAACRRARRAWSPRARSRRRWRRVVRRDASTS